MTLVTVVVILGWVLVASALVAFIWGIVYKVLTHSSKAEKRAAVLLRDVLTPRELRQLFWRGYIDIPSSLAPQRVYRVPRANGYVQVRENGRAIMRLCLQPVERLPDADIVVLHKLMIEAQEEIYLQTANKFRYVN